MSESLTSKERPQFVPAVRKPKLPYLCSGAECVTCKRPVSGDWGLVPDECETCDAERQSRYYRAVAQWAEEEVSRLKAMLEARTPPEATGLQPARRWNAKYPGISMLEHNGELIRSGFGPYVLSEDYDRVASLLSEAVRMIEGYRRAGFITNPAALEQASDFALRAGNSHHE